MKQRFTKLLAIIAFACFGSLAQAQVFTIPYSQDFESFGLCSTGCGATCPLSGGWVNPTTDNLDWLTDNNGTSSTNTGPTGSGGADHNPGVSGGKYLYVETSCSGTGYPSRSAYLHSPSISLVGANSPKVSFWYHMYGTSMGTMQCQISNDGGTTFSPIGPAAWTDNLDLWQLRTLDLTPYVGDTIILRIYGITGSSFGSDMAVDDFEFYDLLPNDAGIMAIDSPSTPACALGSQIYVSMKNHGTDTLDSAQIHWTVNSVAQPTYNWSGALPPDSVASLINIGTFAISPGDTLVAWTEMPNGAVEGATGAGNDTSSTIVDLGLSGSYTIGSTGDYPSFTAAVTALETYGVCGPVVFNVSDSTYTEQLVLTEIIGSSATNTITFRNGGGDSTMTTLTFGAFLSTANFTVQFDGGDHFIFESITIEGTGASYGRVLDYANGADGNTIRNSVVRGNTTSTSTSTNFCVIYSNVGSNDNNNAFRWNVNRRW